MKSTITCVHPNTPEARFNIILDGLTNQEMNALISLCVSIDNYNSDMNTPGHTFCQTILNSIVKHCPWMRFDIARASQPIEIRNSRIRWGVPTSPTTIDPTLESRKPGFYISQVDGLLWYLDTNYTCYIFAGTRWDPALTPESIGVPQMKVKNTHLDKFVFMGRLNPTQVPIPPRIRSQ